MEIGKPQKTVVIYPLEEPIGRPKPIEHPTPEPIRTPEEVPA